MWLCLSLLLATSTEDLYSHRLLFSASGAPVVPIGMMQGAQHVTVHSEVVIVVTAGDKRYQWPAGSDLTIARESGTAAIVQQLMALETLEGAARTTKKAVLARYRERGIAVQAKEVGGVYGVKGTVVDNRAVVIAAVGGDESEAALSTRLTALGLRPTPFEWLASLPSATMTFDVETGVPAPHVGSVTLTATGGGTIKVLQVEHSVGYPEHGFADRELRGEVVIVPDKNGTLAVVNLVDEDAVVAGVLPAEMFATAPMEALKAQAVTARGELFSKINRRHFAEPFLVCSEQHCQVYKGATAQHPRTTKAAQQTRGEMAFVGDRLVESVYSACCGGHTEAADVVWDRPPQAALVGTKDAPHAPATTATASVNDSALFKPVSHVPAEIRTDDDVRALLAAPREETYCGRSTFNTKGDAYRWERHFTVDELTALCADLNVGVVEHLRVIERGPGGRLRALEVQGSTGSARILRELPVRQRFKNLRSGLFVVQEELGVDGRLAGVLLSGAGFGHGSGMCQQGAIGMAESGLSYREILAHYYASAVVKRVF